MSLPRAGNVIQVQGVQIAWAKLVQYAYQHCSLENRIWSGAAHVHNHGPNQVRPGYASCPTHLRHVI